MIKYFNIKPQTLKLGGENIDKILFKKKRYGQGFSEKDSVPHEIIPSTNR